MAPVVMCTSALDLSSAEGNTDEWFAYVWALMNFEQSFTVDSNTNFGSGPGFTSFGSVSITEGSPIEGNMSCLFSSNQSYLRFDVEVLELTDEEWTFEMRLAGNSGGLPDPGTDGDQRDLFTRYSASAAERSFIWGLVGSGTGTHQSRLTYSDDGGAPGQFDIDLGLALEEDKPYDLALERVGDEVYAYVDGDVKGSDSLPAGFSFHPASGVGWRVGLRASTAANSFEGVVDQCRITSAARYSGSSYTPVESFPLS
jgi:hypothetical protein